MDSNLGNKGVVWAALGGEMISVAYELRYMIMFSFVLILADLWWGHSDSMKRYQMAKIAGDKTGMDQYRWRKSRGIRRTANKAIDYLTFLLVGAFMGLAITEPMGWCQHLYAAAFALAIGCLAEIASITGHIFFVKFGIEVRIVDVWKWIGRLFVNILKVKNKDIGEAVDNTIKEKKEEQNADK